MSYIPSTMGQLWNNAGVLSVVSIDQLYNDENTSIDIIAGASLIEGLETGYVEWVQDQCSNGTYLRIQGGTPLISIVFDSVDGFDRFRFGVQGSTITCTYPTPDYRATIRLTFSPSGHSITANGVDVDATYTVGSELTAVYMPATISYAFFNDGVMGFVYNLVISDGTSAILDYTGATSSGTQYTELVNLAHGVMAEEFWTDGATKNFGKYTFPYWTVNRYLADKPVSPFSDVGVDLSVSPRNIDLAYLRYRSGSEPYIPETTVGASYPNFSGVSAGLLERNPNCWYYRKAMTCFSIMSEFYGFAAHATLLSPRHAMIATHVWEAFSVPSALAKTFTFEDMAGNQQTVSSIDYENITSDITIVLLSEEITLDVDYATFLSDADFSTYDYESVLGCGPSKEGYFCIEKIGQLIACGLPSPIDEQEEYLWSRWIENTNRVGDSSSPYFVYNGDTLFFVAIASLSDEYPFGGSCIINNRFDTYHNATAKALIKSTMDALDLRNGGLVNYNLVEGTI